MTGGDLRWMALSLGSNLGDRRALLESAAAHLARELQLKDTRLSGLFETEPWGDVEGPEFLNCVIVGRSPLAASAALEASRGAERRAGAPVEKEGAARSLDVDLLFVQEHGPLPSGLVLPHPRLHLRRFVLLPLSQVWSRPVPGLEATPELLLSRMEGGGDVRQLLPPPPRGATCWKGRP